MTYLIYDSDDELIDVLELETLEAVQLYKKLNPKHVIIPNDELDDIVFIDEEDDLDSESEEFEESDDE